MNPCEQEHGGEREEGAEWGECVQLGAILKLPPQYWGGGAEIRQSQGS